MIDLTGFFVIAGMLAVVLAIVQQVCRPNKHTHGRMGTETDYCDNKQT